MINPSRIFFDSLSSVLLRATTNFLIASKESRKHWSLRNSSLLPRCCSLLILHSNFFASSPLLQPSPPFYLSSYKMDYSRLSETCSPHATALRPEAPAIVPRSSLPSIPTSPLPQALRPQAPIFLPRAQSPPKQVLPPVLPTVHRAVAKEEEELGPAPWEIFDCPHCDRSNGCEWMIACSGEHEVLEWAHLSCVGLSAYDFPDGRDGEKNAY